MNNQNLVPAAVLAAKNGVRFPNESEEYRIARDARLAEEIELRRHIERVAAQRRKLPPGAREQQRTMSVGAIRKRQTPSPRTPTDRHVCKPW